MTQNNVLITGGTGFIGLHLAKYLLDKGDLVTIVDDMSRHGYSRGDKEKEIHEVVSHRNSKLKILDLTRESFFNDLDNNYNRVYHLAAINGTRNFYEKPYEVLRTNTLITLNIVEWFTKFNIPEDARLLFSSSSEVYAGTVNKFPTSISIPTPENVPLVIDDIYNERWSYAISKIVGEALCIHAATREDVPFRIIRYHNIYGPRMGYDHVIPQFITRVLKRENPFKIYGGQATRAFCYIDDAVRATEMVMEQDYSHTPVINIGNSNKEISMREVARELFNIIGAYPRIKKEKFSDGSVQRRCPDTTLLRRSTEFKPIIDLRTGLERTFNWYKEKFDQEKNG